MSGLKTPSRTAVDARVIRLLDIVYLAAADSGWTADKLAARFGVTPRRIFHDLAVLRRAGIRIHHDGDGFHLPPDHPHARVQLGLQDLLSLLRPADPTSDSSRIARRKLASALPPSLRALFDRPERLRIASQVAPVPSSVLNRLDEALADNRCVRLMYRAVRSREAEPRIVDPHAVFARGTGWYLVAWCQTRKALRLFRLDRAESVSPTSRRFERRPDFSLDDFLQDAVGVWKGGELGAVVEVSPNMVPILRSEAAARRLPFRGRPGGGAVLQIPRGHVQETAWWLAQFGEGIRVVQPPELRERLLKIAQEMIRRHEEGVNEGVQGGGVIPARTP